MRLSRLNILATMLLTSSPAAAADWKLVSEDPIADQYVELKSLVVEGSTRTIWVKYIFSEPLFPITNWRSREVFDCTRRRTRILTTLTYAGERHLGSISRADENKWIDLPPDSKGEAVLEKVCALRGP
jgi:hypothetical protein